MNEPLTWGQVAFAAFVGCWAHDSVMRAIRACAGLLTDWQEQKAVRK